MKKQGGRLTVTSIDPDGIADACGLEVEIFLNTCETLGIDHFDLPTITNLLIDAGEQFSGSNAIEAARDWLDEGFDASSTRDWVSAGFWSPYLVSKLYEIGIDANEARLISEGLMSRGYNWGSSPIDALCNGDIGLESFTLHSVQCSVHG